MAGLTTVFNQGGAVAAADDIEWFFQWIEDEEPEHHEDILVINVFDEEDVLYSFLEDEEEAANDEIWIGTEYLQEVVLPVESFSGGWERHPYLRGPKRVRFKFKDEEIPKPVVEIVQSIIKAMPDTVGRDLEIALRLRLRNQEITYRFVYLLLLEREHLRRRQENEAVELLLLH